MDGVHDRLLRLRDVFLVWFVLEAAAGTAVAAYVLDGMSHRSALRHVMGGVSIAGTIASSIVVSLVLLLLAWALLEALLALRPWARIVMLVIGWITVVSAAINLVALPGSAALLETVAGLIGGDWTALAALSVVTKAADLAFWGWVICTLQLNPAVSDAFRHCGPDRTAAG